MSDYNAIDAVNISTLKAIWSDSPRAYRHAVDVGREDKPAFRFGRAVHTAVLEPERFGDLYVVRPPGLDLRTKAGKEWRSSIPANAEILSEDDIYAIAGIENACHENHEIARYLTAPGDVEGALTWTDEETGVRCKGRYDTITADGALFGLKTTNVIHPYKFMASAARYGYHLQWAFYADGCAANGIDVREVVEAVVEKSAPWDSILFDIPDEVIDVGRDEYRKALRTLVECRERNEWPGHAPTGRMTFSLPTWAFADDDDTSDLGLIG